MICMSDLLCRTSGHSFQRECKYEYCHLHLLWYMYYQYLRRMKYLYLIDLSRLCLTFGFHAPKHIWPSNILKLSVPHECYSRNETCTLNLISVFLLYLIHDGLFSISISRYKWDHFIQRPHTLLMRMKKIYGPMLVVISGI